MPSPSYNREDERTRSSPLSEFRVLCIETDALTSLFTRTAFTAKHTTSSSSPKGASSSTSAIKSESFTLATLAQLLP